MNVAPPAPPARHHESSSVVSAIERRLSPGVLLIIAILAMVFFIFGLLNLLIQSLLRLRGARRRRRRGRVGDGGGSPTAFQGQLGQLFHLHDAGVDQAFIDALPVFPYRAVVAGRRDKKDPPFDCAVCLCDFGEDDKLRLLPSCGHAFHVPCIDAWLLSHSTCPLCRGSIVLAECSSPAESPTSPFALESDRVLGGGDEGSEGSSPKAEPEEEIVEVKLGKLRCVDGGNVSARDLGAWTSSSDGDNSGGGNLGQRRCLSMGSYEYVMDDRAALRVAVKTTSTHKTRRPASSRSRRRHALSECEFGGSSNSKKGAWEAAVTTTEAAAASADAGCRCAASLKNKDSFSVSKIWMVSGTSRTTAAELAGTERRAVSFRWPAMASGWRKHEHLSRSDAASFDVEAAAGSHIDSSSVPSLAEEKPSTTARTALLWVAGGRQQSSRGGSHS